MISPIYFRPRPLGVSQTVSTVGTTVAYSRFPGVYQAQVIGGGGGGSGSDTFYGRYGVAGWAAGVVTGVLTFSASLSVTVGGGGGGGPASSSGNLPGYAGQPSSVGSVSSAGGAAGAGMSGSYSAQRPSAWPDGSTIGAGGAGGGISSTTSGSPGGRGAVKLTLIG